MSETKLKPCPFCGGTEVKVMIDPQLHAYGRNIIAHCGDRSCYASVFVSVKEQELVHTPAIDLIADKWNRRANDG